MNVFQPDASPPRLILGTAQLGMRYGIGNVSGQPDRATARRIIEAALENDIFYFDTAQAYGESETLLGTILEELGALAEARIVTKLSATLDPAAPACIEAAIEESLNRLRADRLWGMLIHQPAWLTCWDSGLGDILEHYRVHGRIAALGVSLNTVNDAPAALAHPRMEILQAPCNAWDRRMKDRRFLDAARDQGRLCCIRSVYLQGLLTMTPDAVTARLPAARDAATRWWRLAEEFGASPQELAIRYALTLETPLVVGAETPAQVHDTARMARLAPLTPDAVETIASVMDPALHEEILEPWRWPAS
ncbi:MAG TPA: aldo/keto reductase [Candidatus Hydrogenedentes bacterium]|nr:aldo/keto reductase [Candidatus Hydrogenedentota bacterium]HNT89549.1 aldo/keto reductase [Candidatus Hydrogenedentota bacterium]